ncbi:peptidase inhibitor family I36 protein [Streptosporangium sp. NPDC051022]|uniref:peptidase inhibitor family I36 protein n=1 Tax=Streptosporangium sp. NPDC051022 TaxID=3155752 RepID=UPI003438E6E5
MRFRSQLSILALTVVCALSQLAGTAAASTNPDPQQGAQPAIMTPLSPEQAAILTAPAGPRWVENPALPVEIELKAASNDTTNAAPTCPLGDYCVYYETYRNGGGRGLNGDIAVWSSSLNDQDESSWNNGLSGKGVTLYQNANYRSPLGCLPKGQYWNVHSPMHTGSSNRWIGC